MPPRSDDDVSSLERARERLYKPNIDIPVHSAYSSADERSLPHAWEAPPLEVLAQPGKRHLHLASTFLLIAVAFFIVSLGAAAYYFYNGGNAVSVDKVSIELQGPTTVAGGDTVPLSLMITNRNPVALDNATVEVDFPDGTLTGDGSLTPYPRYVENVGTIESGATVMRSIKAVVFGGAGQTLSLPVSLSYGTGGSSTDFIKKALYTLAISSTPLSVSVDSLSETVSGKPLTFTLTVRSNANIALNNVVLANSFPFGFSVTDSSRPMSGSTIVLGTMQPGESREVTITGTLTGQDGEQRVFHFIVGTAKSSTDPTLVVSYMTQNATIAIKAPFLATTLSINGSSAPTTAIAPGSVQNITVSYTNTLATSVANAVIAVTLSGSAVDYNSIQTTSGFYRSIDHTILFSKDTDPSLASLAPGAAGIGNFSFSTLPSGSLSVSPSVTFTISVSGIRLGQANVPENVTATVTKTLKVATALALSARAVHATGPLENSGPVPPTVDQATTYTILWNLSGHGNAVAGGAVTATLPSYVSYTGFTAGAGSFTYDEKSRSVTWNTGDLPSGASIQGAFQISFTPSLSQKGTSPQLTSRLSFSGYDRFAGIQVTATADPATTETKTDPGYSPTNGTVQ